MEVKIIRRGDEAYSKALDLISTAPKELYCIGDVQLLNTVCVAVVGSRKCTGYGKLVAKEIGKRLSENGITVVSGMARGIDTCAHEGTLEAGGKTIAVLGCGVDLCYPSSNENLKKQIEKNGLIISEYPLGCKVRTFHFPQRNRIISGLAVSTIIVEASNKSGSLITAELAMEQGRNVYAVPGNINSHYSFGSNKLIQDGARPLVVIDDIITDLGIVPCFEDEIYANMGEEERIIFDVIKNNGEVTTDYIYHITNIKPSRINGIITILEMKGIIISSFGKVFVAKF